MRLWLLIQSLKWLNWHRENISGVLVVDRLLRNSAMAPTRERVSRPSPLRWQKRRRSRFVIASKLKIHLSVMVPISRWWLLRTQIRWKWLIFRCIEMVKGWSVACRVGSAHRTVDSWHLRYDVPIILGKGCSQRLIRSWSWGESALPVVSVVDVICWLLDFAFLSFAFLDFAGFD